MACASALPNDAPGARHSKYKYHQAQPLFPFASFLLARDLIIDLLPFDNHVLQLHHIALSLLRAYENQSLFSLDPGNGLPS